MRFWLAITNAAYLEHHGKGFESEAEADAFCAETMGIHGWTRWREIPGGYESPAVNEQGHYIGVGLRCVGWPYQTSNSGPKP